MARGSCLCGDVSFEVSGGFELMAHCHCSMCRKTHGAPFATFVGGRGFHWTSGSDKVTRYESSPGLFRAFCARCGASTPDPGREEEVTFVPAGLLADDPGVRPAAHLFAPSKVAWYQIPDALPQLEGYPPGFDAPRVEPGPERTPSEPGIVRGSCLCAGAAYEVEGDAQTIIFCHCSRCRRARAAAHFANVLVPSGTLRYLRGEELLVDYVYPEAKRFGSRFCRVCGSGLPRTIEGSDRIGAIAGSVDGDPGARPGLHIFAGSKAPWFEIADDLPQFETLPPGAR